MVGHSDDEDSLSSVRGAKVRGADEAGEHSIAEPAEVTRNSVQPSRNKGRDVFSDDHVRLALVDDSRELGPQAGARPVEPGALARDRDVLTRESSDDGERLKSECGWRDILNPPKLRCVWPMLAEHSARESVGFSDRAHLAEARELASKIETADAGEEREDGTRGSHRSLAIHQRRREIARPRSHDPDA